MPTIEEHSLTSCNEHVSHLYSIVLIETHKYLLAGWRLRTHQGKKRMFQLARESEYLTVHIYIIIDYRTPLVLSLYYLITKGYYRVSNMPKAKVNVSMWQYY
jgi:hypothetical protein